LTFVDPLVDDPSVEGAGGVGVLSFAELDEIFDKPAVLSDG
jgi:hypothetical protein